MKIAITHSSFYTSGGMERLPLQQAFFLQDRGHRVSVFSSANDIIRCHPQIMSKLDVKQYSISFPSSVFGKGFSHILSLTALLKTSMFKDFDVLICHVQPSPWIGYMVKRRHDVPYIHYAQGICRQIYPRKIDLQTRNEWDLERKIETYFFKVLNPLRKLDFKSINAADKVIANSKHVAKEIEKFYGREDVITCYPAVNFDKFKPLTLQETSYVMKKFSISRPLLFTTNRHESHKKLEWLIRLLPRIKREHPKATLVITGSFSKHYTPILIKITEKLNLQKNVIFTGIIGEQDLISLYNQSDIYLFSSPQEDFGLGPVEAMACGTPAIAWDYAGPKETIIDGITGYLVQPYDHNSFVEKTLRILSDDTLRKKREKDCIKHVRDNFGWRQHIETMEKALLELFKRS